MLLKRFAGVTLAVAGILAVSQPAVADETTRGSGQEKRAAAGWHYFGPYYDNAKCIETLVNNSASYPTDPPVPPCYHVCTCRSAHKQAGASTSPVVARDDDRRAASPSRSGTRCMCEYWYYYVWW